MSDTPKIIESTHNVGAAQSYVEGEFGGPVTEKETIFQAPSATVLKITSENPDRVGLIIMNLTNSPMYLGLNNNPGIDNGLTLLPNGGSISMIVRDDMMLTTRQWHLATTSTFQYAYVLEVFRYALT